MTAGCYRIRIAEPEDEPAVQDLLVAIKKEFRENSINMWQNRYPFPEDIHDDITSGDSYVAVRYGDVVGFMYVHNGPEEYHATLSGEWRGSRCTVLHHFLTDKTTRGTGLGKMMIDFWEDVSRRDGFTSMRTETDSTNIPMTKLLHRCGFADMGEVWIYDSYKLAFEKLILHSG